jgi:hypothetical protein
MSPRLKEDRTMKTLALAMIMAMLAASAALATDGPGGPTDGTGRSGASAAASTGGDHSSAGQNGGHVTPDGSKPGVGSGSN